MLSLDASQIAERAAPFDYSEEIHWAGGAAARHNWQMMLAHTSAEWSGDLDATMETMTRNDPFQIMYATGLEVRGYEAMREFYRVRLTTFQGQGFFPHRWVVSDDLMVGNGYFYGTPTGTFFGMPTSGKTLCLPMTVWIYFEDGLIKGEVAYLDGHELRQQMLHGTSRRPTDPVL
ncbi:MAG TPA: ester cyclase [Beijerinckiaceae bacterium]|jgi:predicted ester cyclase|nr:ester cyclase [Beijerinckiaceae bacterium]